MSIRKPGQWRLSSVMSSFLTNVKDINTNSTRPKAFLNWVLFDNQLNYVTGGGSQMPSISGGMSKQVISGSIPVVQKSGYLYIYLSNESNQDVYFDNLNVQFKRGPLLEETHYYPFGLTMTGISDKALKGNYAENKYRFQKQELQNKEFRDGSGLEMYEFKYRFYDCQTGRFWSIDPLADKYEYNSPYAFSEDKVTSHVELEGLEATPINAFWSAVKSEIQGVAY